MVEIKQGFYKFIKDWFTHSMIFFIRVKFKVDGP